MPKINKIIDMPYKRVEYLYASEKEKEAYRGAESDIGNKSIVLDIRGVEKIVNDVVAKYDSADRSTNKSHVASDIAFSLKEQENKIIMEGI